MRSVQMASATWTLLKPAWPVYSKVYTIPGGLDMTGDTQSTFQKHRDDPRRGPPHGGELLQAAGVAAPDG